MVEERPSWAVLVDQARAHGVLPLLFRNLAELRCPEIPPPVLAELAAAYRENAVHNALLAHELTRVLSVLGEAGVPAIPLKGVVLAESLYGDLALRVSSDLDILVPRPLATRARDSILALDYRAEFTEQFFADLLLRHDVECAFARRSRSSEYRLDLHWGLAWPGSQDRRAADHLWAAARRGRFRGTEVFVLSPEWELLFLALHTARHQWQLLKWLVDVHEVCVRGGIDWTIVREEAGRCGWDRALRMTLSVGHFLLDTPLPPDFSEGPLPPWLKPFPLDPGSARAWGHALFPLRLVQRPSERLRYLARLLLVPTLAERRLVRLPSSLSPLYYPLRPVRLSGKWIWHGVRSSAGRVVRSLCATE